MTSLWHVLFPRATLGLQRCKRRFEDFGSSRRRLENAKVSNHSLTKKSKTRLMRAGLDGGLCGGFIGRDRLGNVRPIERDHQPFARRDRVWNTLRGARSLDVRGSECSSHLKAPG